MWQTSGHKGAHPFIACVCNVRMYECTNICMYRTTCLRMYVRRTYSCTYETLRTCVHMYACTYIHMADFEHTYVHTSALPLLYLSSAQLYLSSPSALAQLYLSSTSALPHPYLSATSNLHQPSVSSTSALPQPYRSSCSRTRTTSDPLFLME